MSKLDHLLVLSLTQLILLSSVKADYRLAVRALSYENPSNRRIDGQCCDFSLRSCRNQCDTHLDFCLRPPGYSEDEWPRDDCPLGEYSTGGVGGDDITFEDSIGSLDNPFYVPVQGDWMGSFQLLVEVHDSDSITADDLVDIIYASPYNLSVGMATTRTYGGQRARITLEFRVVCASDFYGPTCSTYCSETDSNGRYTCDPRTGEKLCLPGFTDPDDDCNTVTTEGPPPVETGTTSTTSPDTTTGHTVTPPTDTPPSTTDEAARSGPVEQTTSTDSATSTAVTAAIANQGASKRKNISAIIGPLIAAIVVMVIVIIVVGFILFWRRNKRYTQDQLTERMLDTQTGITDGIPNATYNPSAVGVVYPNKKAGTYEERNFDNPIYHSVLLNYSRVDADAANGSTVEGRTDTMSSSGLYSTIDNRSPRRSWALRPVEHSGLYSSITNPP